MLIYRRTASPALASLTFALSFIPYFLGGTAFSALVDRIRPRRLVAGGDALSTVLIAAIALPRAPLALIFTLLFAAGLLSSLSSGARAALVRASVSDDAYVPARSLLRIAAQLSQIAGNAGGGFLLVLVKPSGALLVAAGAFLASSAVVRFRVRDHPSDGAPGEARLVSDSLRGARAVLAQPELRRLLLAGWFAPMFLVAPEALAAPYVASHRGSSVLVGWWLVALPVGLIAGDSAGVRLLRPAAQRSLVAPAAVVEFAPYLVFGLDPPIPAAFVLLVLSGLCGFYTLGLDARIRDAAPPELFARTMTVSTGGQMALQGAGFALAGAIAEATGPARSIAISGACGLAITAALLRGDFSRSPSR